MARSHLLGVATTHVARRLPYLGSFVIVLALGKVHARYIGHYDFSGSTRFAWSIAYGAAFCIAAYGVDLPRSPSRRVLVGRAALATLVAAMGISVAQLAAGSALLPRFVVLAAAISVALWDILCIALLPPGEMEDPSAARMVAVVSAGEALLLRDDLSAGAERPVLLLHAGPVGQAGGTATSEEPLRELVGRFRANLVVLNRAAEQDERMIRQAVAVHASGVRIRSLSRFYDDWLGKVQLSELEPAALMLDVRSLHSRSYQRLKRLVDVVVGLLGALALLLVLPVVVVGNWLGNRGELFFVQERVGKNGDVFRMYKFRTMRAGSDPTEWAAEGDSRVTAFGRWMRRIHVDELPQMLNILKGDLSLVGPRPEQPHYVENLRRKFPLYDFRLIVRPGLTGWAQVRYRYASSELDAVEKLQYELYYIYHQSLVLDLRILARTLRTVMTASGQ